MFKVDSNSTKSFTGEIGWGRGRVGKQHFPTIFSPSFSNMIYILIYPLAIFITHNLLLKLSFHNKIWLFCAQI